MPRGDEQYSVGRSGDLVRLADAANRTVVSLITSVGNVAFEMKVHGQHLLHWPYATIEEFKARPALSGIPLLAPWANRLDEQAFYANGIRHALDPRITGTPPIHGFLSYTDQWRLVEATANDASAWVTSVLEFESQPAWMAQFPFPHNIQMTHRLQEGVLEVRTTITNCGDEPMPVAIGFHPYLRLTDCSRNEWTISVPARTRWLLSPLRLPTGETEPVEQLWQTGTTALKDRDLDDVFGDLDRDSRGCATVALKGRRQQIEVILGPNWKSLVIYSPPTGADFVCVEPMAGITNGMNLAQRGIYKEQQYISPGGRWEASFWIRPSGFN